MITELGKTEMQIGIDGFAAGRQPTKFSEWTRVNFPA